MEKAILLCKGLVSGRVFPVLVIVLACVVQIFTITACILDIIHPTHIFDEIMQCIDVHI